MIQELDEGLRALHCLLDEEQAELKLAMGTGDTRIRDQGLGALASSYQKRASCSAFEASRIVALAASVIELSDPTY